uniref:Uncharacterized protein n=1 Tax=Romanomermis culicivorax TaxID=13658 RepID=A0A915J3N7_ROMCU
MQKPQCSSSTSSGPVQRQQEIDDMFSNPAPYMARPGSYAFSSCNLGQSEKEKTNLTATK